MRSIVSILSTALLAFALGLYLPWWSVALAAFIISLLALLSPLKSFLCGFLGIFSMWATVCVCINSGNNGILAARVASILPLGGSVFMLIFATAFLGALVGGTAALTGSLLRKTIRYGGTA